MLQSWFQVMEHERCMEENSESSGCRKISCENDSDIASDLPMKIDKKEEVENNFVSPTPQKPEWSSKDRAVASLTRKQLAEDFENEGCVDQFSLCIHHEKPLTYLLVNILLFQDLLG